MSDKKWDAFICHANEDKTAVARPLAEMLHNKGLEIWYDDLTLKIGDSLSRSINHGLANSQYGIVILSDNFFSKDWPQKELEGLVAKEIGGKKVILPVWHEITKEKITEYCPILAGMYAANTKYGLESVVEKIVEVIGVPLPLPPLSPLLNQPDRILSHLIRKLRNGNDRERNQAARSLKEFNRTSVVDALLDAVKYDRKVRYEALLSLYELRSKKARETFIDRLEDPSPRIRHISILALGEIGELTAIEPLQKIIDTYDFKFCNKGQQKNWGKSENVLIAKNSILSIQKRLKTP